MMNSRAWVVLAILLAVGGCALSFGHHREVANEKCTSVKMFGISYHKCVFKEKKR